MAGAHTSEKRWYRDQNPNGNDSIADQVQEHARIVIHELNRAEAMFAEMQELYTYCGSTMQGLADQLFKEKWEARTEAGVNAVVTVDVSGGVITGAAITTAGTGYTDGTGYTLTVAGGNADGVISYDVVSGSVTNVAVDTAGTGYTDGLGQTVTNFPVAGQVPETQANATELAMTQDAFDAVTAMHDLYQAMTNVAVPQEDRLAQLRRMS